MRIAVEISMYPLTEDYEPPILAFIEKLKSSGLSTKTNGMSTQIFGEFDEVMKWVNDGMKAVFDKNKAVFNLKVLKNPLPEDFSL